MPFLSITVARLKSHFTKHKTLNDGTTITISGKGKIIKATTTTTNGKTEVLRTSTDATAEHAEFTSAAAATAHLLSATKPKSKKAKNVTFTSSPDTIHTYEHPADYHCDFRLKKEEYKELQRQFGGKVRCEGVCKQRRKEKAMRRSVVTIDDLGNGKKGYEKVEWRNNQKRMKVAGNLFM